MARHVGAPLVTRLTHQELLHVLIENFASLGAILALTTGDLDRFKHSKLRLETVWERTE
jgi:hypothetical protein